MFKPNHMSMILFLSIFYLTEPLENAYIKSLDSMQKLTHISDFSREFQF